MQAAQIKPSNVTFSILVKIYSRLKQLDSAIGLLDQMRQCNVKPGIIVYTCLIQTCIGVDQIQRAEEIFHRMRHERVRPDAVMFATLIKGQLRHHRYQQALCTARLMIEERPTNSTKTDCYAEMAARFEHLYLPGKLASSRCQDELDEVRRELRKLSSTCVYYQSHN
jgi:pentatricopeptide repeat protein